MSLFVPAGGGLGSVLASTIEPNPPLTGVQP